MFTGIVQDMGKILAKEQSEDGASFEIESGKVLDDLKPGDSISVDGVCLTVAERMKGAIRLELAPETLRCSNLGERQAGDQVNLEPSAKLTDFLGGHLVQGHVDQTGEVLAVTEEGNSRVFRIAAPEEILRYCTLKGSITVNGVSLTLSALNAESFEVTIIPHTLKVTNFKQLKVGDSVNLESDVVSKYVESHVSQYLESHVRRLSGLFVGFCLLSSSLLFGGDLSLGPNSILVYSNQSRQQKETQFVFRLGRYRPDIVLEWESRTDQGTIHLHQRAVSKAGRFTVSALFEVGVDVESSEMMTLWLSEKIYRDLTEKGKAGFELNRSAMQFTVKGEGTYSLTINKKLEEIPVLHVEDNRKGSWTFYKNPENPLLVEYVTPYFHQHLKTVSTSPSNKLRWISVLPPIK